ncbi:type II CAAX endopeptidase family protein [Phycisphaeraceae bacterium D3-23]
MSYDAPMDFGGDERDPWQDPAPRVPPIVPPCPAAPNPDAPPVPPIHPVQLPPQYGQPSPQRTPPAKPTKPPAKPLSPTGRIRVGLAWFWIVVFCIVAIFVQHAQTKLIPSDPIATTRPDSQFTVQAKITLYMDRINSGSRNSAQQSQIDDAVHQLEGIALNSRDLIRTAIIRGEVYGSEDALYTLDEIRTPGLFTVSPTEEDLVDMALLEKVYQNQPLTDAEADRLNHRHLWFGELATTYNQPPAQSAHKQPRASSTRLAFGFAFIGIVVVLMGLAGLVLMILGLFALASGKITFRYKAEARAGEAPLLLESVVIFLFLFVLTGVLTLALFEQYDLLIGVGGLAVIALCALTPLLFGLGWGRYRQLVGLHRGQGLLKEIACGAVGYLAGIPLIVVGFGISFILFFIALAIWPPDPDLPIFDPLAGLSPAGLVALVLMLVVWAPIVEEIIFRGYFYAHCRRWMHWSVSALVVGVAFAAIHPQGIWFVPGLTSVAFVLAMIREWRGSLVGSMTAHAIHNGTVATLLVVMTLA